MWTKASGRRELLVKALVALIPEKCNKKITLDETATSLETKKLVCILSAT